MCGIRYVYPHLPGVAPAPSAPRQAARQAARPAARAGFDYEFAPTRDVDATYRAVCRQTLREANKMLAGQCDGVQVAYFAPLANASRYIFSSGHPIGGRTDVPNALIWIADGMPLEEAVRGVAHESRHFWQCGKGMSIAAREHDASIFAWAFWRAHGAAIESWARTWGRWDTRA